MTKRGLQINKKKIFFAEKLLRYEVKKLKKKMHQRSCVNTNYSFLKSRKQTFIVFKIS